MGKLTQEREELLRRFHEIGEKADHLDVVATPERWRLYAQLAEAQASIFAQLIGYEMFQFGVSLAPKDKRPADDEWGS